MASKNKPEAKKIESITLLNHPKTQRLTYAPWSTVAFTVPKREIFSNVEFSKKDSAEITYNSIYFLIGYNENGKTCVYVGQASSAPDNMGALRRIKQPHGNKKFADHQWEDAVIFVNEKNKWQTTELDTLEGLFISMIKDEVSWNAKDNTLGEEDVTDYVDYVNQIKGYLWHLQYKDIFKEEITDETKDNEGTQITSLQLQEVKNVHLPVEDLQNWESRIPEVVTPQAVVDQMINMLPDDVWTSKTKFLDPACKGGEYLRAIYDKLYNSDILKREFENPTERSIHILSNQIYGIALSDISRTRTKTSLFGFDKNIRRINGYIGKLKGINLGKRQDGTPKNIKDIIDEEFGEDMKIDVVIGNPPYQELTGGGVNGGKALWDKFIVSAIEYSPSYICMITPSRWFTGGQGLNQFRIDWLNDSRISNITHFQNAYEVFPGTSIAGGVNYFLWKHDKKDNIIEYINKLSGECGTRVLNKYDIFIASNMEETIVDKVVSKNTPIKDKVYSMSDLVGSGGQYGLPTNFLGLTGKYKVITSNGICYCDEEDLKELPKGYRVVTSNVMSEHAGESSKSGTYKVLTVVMVVDPDTVTAGHYVTVGSYQDIGDAHNCAKYLKTKMLRCLLRVRAVGIGIASNSYKFIPIQDFTNSGDIDWSQPIENIDKQLYKKYGLTQEEINYIEKTIKPME